MKNSIVEVFWEDARVSVDGSMPELPVMRSIGVIIDRNKKRILLCSMFGMDKDPRIITAIPTSLVRNVRRVR